MTDTQLFDQHKPWASFCMSTFKRPQFLKEQLNSLLQQTFTDFEIVVSDNDPEAGAREIAQSFNDPRIRYHCNSENLGMIRSFNKSIDRASGEYIVMITDDDPVETGFLQFFFEVCQRHPGYSLYGGFGRVGKAEKEVELIDKDRFLIEMLDPERTHELLWSSCLIDREALLQIGKLPDYGSPHLFDHAMLAMAGSVKGAVMVNKMYSQYYLHGDNFSKSNFNSYYISCTGFYNLLSNYCRGKAFEKEGLSIVQKHLGKWFIVNIFGLKKYFSRKENFNTEKLAEIKALSSKMLALPFMKSLVPKFYAKSIIFMIKKNLGLF